MNFNTYPSYKRSGCDWLPEIPSHWQMLPVKRLFRLVAEAAPSNNDHELLSVYTAIGVKPRKDLEQKGNKASTTDGYWLVRKGDIIVNKLLAWMGAVGYSEYEGVTSPAYDILRPIKDFDPRFFHYLFRSPLMNQEFKRWSRGIMEMRLRLYFDSLGKILVPVPPQPELQNIVSFISSATRALDELVDEKQNLLSLLKEKRSSLIDIAVNNPETVYLKLKHCVYQKMRFVERIDEQEYCPLGLYNRGRGIFHKEPTKGKDLGDSTFYYVKEGDLILSGQFAWEGSVAIAGHSESGCIVSHRYPVITGDSGVLLTEYLWAFFTTKLGDFLLNECSRGAAGRNRPLNINLLLNEKIPVPPLPEQQKVVDVVKKEAALKKAVSESESFIFEHKSSLIFAAVTGKIDVRNYAEDAA